MAQNPTKYGTSPTGRLISGDPWTKQTTDANNRPIPPEKQNFWFAVAIEKNAPGVNDMLGNLYNAAMEGYASAPHVLAQVKQGLTAPQFSWKVDDGDEMRVNPQTGAQEPRWKHGAGCWIFKFSTTLSIRSAKYQGAVPVDCAPSEIKRGYYVQVAYSTSANGNMDHTAGVYLNAGTVCLVAYGQEIVSGPSLEQQFGAGPGGYLPAGATTTPQAPMGAAPLAQPGPMGNPAQTGMGMPGPAQTGMGMPGPAPAGYQQPGPTQTPAAPLPTSMPQPNAGGMATGYPGNAPAQSYGGYMQPGAQQAAPAQGGGMPGA
jgi:hypothetical protein